MKNSKIRILTALFAVVLCMAVFPLTAFAGGGDESEPPAEPITEPEPATVNPVSLTPDGNLTLVDDIDEQDGESLKQFITVVTKDGKYFYIIIDRVGDKENVHFLNMVDEADLTALIEDMDTAPAQPVPVTPEPDPEPGTRRAGAGSRGKKRRHGWHPAYRYCTDGGWRRGLLFQSAKAETVRTGRHRPFRAGRAGF